MSVHVKEHLIYGGGQSLVLFNVQCRSQKKINPSWITTQAFNLVEMSWSSQRLVYKATSDAPSIVAGQGPCTSARPRNV